MNALEMACMVSIGTTSLVALVAWSLVGEMRTQRDRALARVRALKGALRARRGGGPYR